MNAVDADTRLLGRLAADSRTTLNNMPVPRLRVNRRQQRNATDHMAASWTFAR